LDRLSARSYTAGVRVLALAVLFGCGCGRLQFDPVDAQAAGSDGPDDASMTACDPTAPFGAPRLIAELSTPGALYGTLRLLPDELSGYYWSNSAGVIARNIYYVSRPSLTAPFTRVLVQGINTAASELDPTITSDGTLLVYRRSGPGNRLFSAVATAPDVFTMEAEIANLNTASGEFQSYLPTGRDELYFSSARTGAGDIYVSGRSGRTFGPPILLVELASPMDDGDPVVSADGLTIYFRSNRPAAIAGFNIHVATRASTADAFGTPVLVDNVNSAADDGPSWISLDGCRLYMASDIAGSNDVYVATRGT
jgi:hypothetical protein